MLGGASPSDVDAHVIGLITILIAIAITMYGVWIYYWRLQIKRKEARSLLGSTTGSVGVTSLHSGLLIHHGVCV